MSGTLFTICDIFSDCLYAKHSLEEAVQVAEVIGCDLILEVDFNDWQQVVRRYVLESGAWRVKAPQTIK